MASLERVSEIVWKQCIRAKKAEEALIITDPAGERLRIGNSLLKAATCSCRLMKMKPTGMHGREPEPGVAKAMKGFDVVLAPTAYSITHTKATAAAIGNGARVATMPGISIGMFRRAIPVDYAAMSATCERLRRLLANAASVSVTTVAGTDIAMELEPGRKVSSDNGIVDRPGKLNNLPAGEVAVAPMEGTANGIIVFDLSSMDQRMRRPFRVEVRGGHAVSCGNAKLWRSISSVANGTNLAELGIGTNPKARITGKILEDEKVMGTAHIAFGTSAELGGKIQTSIHLDSVFARPTIMLDGKAIIGDGKFLF